MSPVSSGCIRQIGAGEDGNDFVAALLDVFAATFLSIEQHQNESNVAASLFDRVDRLNGRAAGGNDIVNDDDGIAG
jgi:hypothetical protein